VEFVLRASSAAKYCPVRASSVILSTRTAWSLGVDESYQCTALDKDVECLIWT
jgi:hypothetical protein